MSGFLVVMLFLLSASTLQAQVVPCIDGNTVEWGSPLLDTEPTYQYVADVREGNQDNAWHTGAKDIIDYGPDGNQWTYTSVLSKGDIMNAAAVVLTGLENDPENCDAGFDYDPLRTYLFFAGDRESNNGVAQIGFWFYLDGSAPVEVNGDKYLEPKHAIGDLLIMSDFSAGGRLATVTVLQWVDPNGVAGNYSEDQHFDQLPLDSQVAINNDGNPDVPTPWAGNVKPGQMVYDYNEFYEGVVDLTDVFDLNQNPEAICGAGWLLETRSSKEITAKLKDFTGGQFNLEPTATVNSPTVCVEDPATLEATVFQGAIEILNPVGDGYTFQWWKGDPENGGMLLEDVDTATDEYVIDPTTSNDAGAYYVIVFSPQGCESQGSAFGTLTLNPLPDVSADDETLACTATTVQLTGSPEGGTWSGDHVSASGLFDATGLAPDDYVVTYNYTDPNTNCTNSAEATITVDIAPELTVTCPDPVSVDCNDDIATAFSTWLGGFSSSEGGGTVTETYNVTVDGNPVAIGDLVAPTYICDGSVINITFMASDECDQEEECSSSFTLEADTTPPTASNPASDTVDCGNIPNPDPLVVIDESDNCGTPVVTHLNDTEHPGVCGGTFVRTYRVTDTCGQYIDVQQTINVNPAPEATVADPGFPESVSCDVADGWEAPNTTYGNGADGNCTISGELTPTVDADWNNCGGTITVSYSGQDECGRPLSAGPYVINVDAAPEATVADPGFPESVSCDVADGWEAPNTTYGNGADGNCTISGELTPTVDADWNNCGGTITVSYSGQDECGRPLSAGPYVINVDAAPEATVADPGFPESVSCDVADGWEAPNTTYGNGADGNCTISGELTPTVDADWNNCGGTITVSYSGQDECGRPLSAGPYVINVDAVPKASFDAISNIDIYCEDLDSFVPGMLSYGNGEDGACIISGQVQGVSDPFEGNCGQFDVHFSYTDECGRTITATQVVTVIDETAPVITCPEPMTICNDSFPAELTANWTDNCLDGGTLTVGPINIRYRDDMCAELADYVFTISDGCGNETTEICTITREFDKYDNCETAFAMDMETASCFIPDFKRWGWTNSYNEGDSSELPLYAGAAHCDYENKGTLVGSVTVDYSVEGEITVTYNINEGYGMKEAHVYVGCDMYPEKKGTPTVAPGQYTFNSGSLDNSNGISVTFDNVYGPVYVIAHAVTCEELCKCSDRPWSDDGNTYNVDLGINCGGEAKVAVTKSVDFTAYPVPFDEEVNIKYSFDYETDVTIEVFDMKGALVRKAKNTNYMKGMSATTKMNLSGTDNQMFFVRLTTNAGTLVKKIVSYSEQ
ncbi:T9SS type A sorting domain-containing protein [Snuella sedimenti]|uniref:T9SS type A sorting domain-containing protein n=1 Tax=Snuella sedimenti TaxID=2798802 RepID=A0A8J7IJJ0_9FLAO|nr:T9SS type A sorting domain-containing protein [Snuella sedimenti]MBJ6369406.1 T9SS type A sorting domain-containing protein [Snuella sedimenti]